MNRGLYIGYSAMAVSRAALEVKANNLTNLSTPGYKSDSVVMRNFSDEMRHAMLGNGTSPLGSGTPGVELDGTWINTTQGALRQTGNQWDLAIVGTGFFALQDGENTYYTRNGQFHLDADGFVVNDRGWYLQGQDGPIRGEGLTIGEDGTLFNNGEPHGVIPIVSPSPETLEKVTGDTFISADGQPVQGEYRLAQGFLEQANTNLGDEMTDMLILFRLFESAQKIVTTQDRLLEIAANQIGNTRG